MEKFKFVAVGAISLIMGFAANSVVMSAATPGLKVATVDVQSIVSKSKMVNTLKDAQKAKVDDLAKFAANARTEVAKEKDPKAKKALEDKYNAELNAKKDTIDKDYITKLGEIDKSITAQISQMAKTQGYDLVLSKGVVLYGGEDITAAVTKIVK